MDGPHRDQLQPPLHRLHARPAAGSRADGAAAAAGVPPGRPRESAARRWRWRRCSPWRCSPAAAAGGGGGDDGDRRPRRPRPKPAPQVDRRDRRPAASTPPRSTARPRPGVVTIRSIFDGSGGAAEGSGFVLDTDGEIVTNAHVVTDESSGSAQAGQGSLRRVPRPQRRRRPKIVGFDPFADVALLEVEPDGFDLHPLQLGDDARPRRRPAGGGDRQPLRRAALALGRGRLGHRPLGRIADPVPDRGRDPDRRLDQPRQLGRPAARRRRPRDRHQPADRDQLGRQRRRRLRGADLGDQALGRPAGAKTATPNTPTSASPARRSTRSSPTSSASTPTYGGLLAEVVPGGPADEGRASRAATRSSASRPAEYRTGGDVILAVDGHEVVQPDDLARFDRRLQAGRKGDADDPPRRQARSRSRSLWASARTAVAGG